MAHEETPHGTSEQITAQPGHHGHAAAVAIFPEAEWQEFRKEDYYAARAIISLMAGIFTLGLIGYLAVAIWVSGGA
jgi:hypothetical protein